jgi:hypothetical protein
VLSAVCAVETFRMEVLSNGIQTISFDFVIAFVTRWCNEFFETVFAVELSLFLDETDVLQAATALWIHADKVLRAPDLSQRRNEWTPDLGIAGRAERDAQSRSSLIQNSPTAIRSTAASEGSALVTAETACT